MNIIETPNLTEPGVKYFLKETLKKCNEKKGLFYNTILNLGFLFNNNIVANRKPAVFLKDRK